MTIKTWRYEILKVCKTCNFLFDFGRNRYRYHCKKYNCHCYKAHGCIKTRSIREQAAKISEEALNKAFNELIGGWKKS